MRFAGAHPLDSRVEAPTFYVRRNLVFPFANTILRQYFQRDDISCQHRLLKALMPPIPPCILPREFERKSFSMRNNIFTIRLFRFTFSLFWRVKKICATDNRNTRSMLRFRDEAYRNRSVFFVYARVGGDGEGKA